MKKRRSVWLAAALGGALALFATFSCEDEEPSNPHNASFKFEQLNLDVNDQKTQNSAWGAVTMTFDGAADILYFNLAVGNRWVIRNIPAFSPQGLGAPHTYVYGFDLGVEDGTNVSRLSYAFDLGYSPSASMPAEYQKAPVADRDVVFASGFLEADALVLQNPPAAEVGGSVVDSAYHPGIFPNAGAGKNECVPAAVSNSLRFLNDKYGLGLSEEQTKVATMKDATGWKRGGCSYEWYKAKDNYMKTRKYPITTRKVSASCGQIINEIKEGRDVELCTKTHCAAVVGIAKLKNGKFALYVTHDTEQGETGGEMTEKIMYDPKAGKLEGSPGLFHGSSILYFVVEAPAE